MILLLKNRSSFLNIYPLNQGSPRTFKKIVRPKGTSSDVMLAEQLNGLLYYYK